MMMAEQRSFETGTGTRQPGDSLFRLGWTVLFALSLAVLVGGALLALFPDSSLMNLLMNGPIERSFFPGGMMPEMAEPYRNWLYGVLGGSLMGWGGLMAWIVATAFRERRRWAWTALATALMAWFVLDTAMSARYGVTYNVLLNVLLLAAFAIPLALCRSAFTADLDEEIFP